MIATTYITWFEEWPAFIALCVGLFALVGLFVLFIWWTTPTEWASPIFSLEHHLNKVDVHVNDRYERRWTIVYLDGEYMATLEATRFRWGRWKASCHILDLDREPLWMPTHKWRKRGYNTPKSAMRTALAESISHIDRQRSEATR